MEQRAHAVKCLAQHARQPFDREAPSDPGFWSEQQIRTDEIRAWLDAGCPAGPGYDKPIRDPALDSPTTSFEVLVAKLDRILAKHRERDQDPANPANWLTPSSPRDLEAIKQRWQLPSTYVDFLARFSPLRVGIENEMFEQGFTLFGAANLIAGQAGYAESAPNRRLDEWPQYLVVIGTDAADPYVLDLSRSNGTDAPILTASHGRGTWDFDEVTSSFEEFIELLVE